MSQGVWAYFVVMMGLLALFTVNYVGNFANNNELDYYALKEIQTSAMMDAIDLRAYREDNEFRIKKEVFIELFTKRFANQAGVNRKYKITFKKIIENPPMTSILIESSPNTTFASTSTIDDLIIKNSGTGVLLLEHPVINIAKSTNKAPNIGIRTMYKPCPYVNGKMDTTVSLSATVYVTGVETDNPLRAMTSTLTNFSKGTPMTSKTGIPEHRYDLSVIPGEDRVYEIKGRVEDAAGLFKEATESVILNANDKCIQVIQRPSVRLDPMTSCNSGEAKVNVEVTSVHQTDIYYQLNNGPVVKVENEKSTTITITNIGNNTLKVWATPVGSGQYENMSVEKIGTYNVLKTDGAITVTPVVKDSVTKEVVEKNQWVKNSLVVEVDPKFERGEANESNTTWEWWTRTMEPPGTSYGGFQAYSSNLGRKTKNLIEEGRRQFRITADIPASEVGLGCTNVRLSTPDYGDYLIDKQNPSVPDVHVHSLNTNIDNTTQREEAIEYYQDTDLTNHANTWINASEAPVVLEINGADEGYKNNNTATGSGIDYYERVEITHDDTRDIEYYEEQIEKKKSIADGIYATYQVKPEDDVYFTNTWQARRKSRIYIRSVDVAGNKSGWRAFNLYIDPNRPLCASSGGSNTWYRTNRTITGVCTDQYSETVGSGCTAATAEVSRTLIADRDERLSPGTVEDIAGNERVCPTQRVRIDKTDPVFSINCVAASACSLSGGFAVVRGSWSSVDDSMSGVNSAKAWFGSGWEATVPIDASLNGSSKNYDLAPGVFVYFRFTAEDKAGNSIDKSAACPTWWHTPRNDSTVPPTPARCGWN